MGPLLYNLAILNYSNLVSVLDGEEVVSYHDAGATFSGFIQRFLDNLWNEQSKMWIKNKYSSC